MTENQICPDGYKRYRLRRAAGKYWLIDTGQTGFPYNKPVILNEGGAYIWQRYIKGMEPQMIAADMSNEYDIPEKEALLDIKYFIKQIKSQGIKM